MTPKEEKLGTLLLSALTETLSCFGPHLFILLLSDSRRFYSWWKNLQEGIPCLRRNWAGATIPYNPRRNWSSDLLLTSLKSIRISSKKVTELVSTRTDGLTVISNDEFIQKKRFKETDPRNVGYESDQYHVKSIKCSKVHMPWFKSSERWAPSYQQEPKSLSLFFFHFCHIDIHFWI